MLAKRTVRNQITLPKTVVARFGDVEYFDVSTDGETIILRPLEISRADEVRARLEELGVEEQDVSDAVSWARQADRRREDALDRLRRLRRPLPAGFTFDRAAANER